MPNYNILPPTPSGKNTINSITAAYGIRDFLLLKNLVPTGKYLTKLGFSPSVKVGAPVTDTMVGNGSITIPNYAPIETVGILWKIQNVLGNTFKNVAPNNNDFAETITAYAPYTKFGSAYFPISTISYPKTPIDDFKIYGVYGKTVNSNFKQDNVSKNKFLDTIIEDMSDYTGLVLPIPYVKFGSAYFPITTISYPKEPIDDFKKYGVYGKTVNANFKQGNLSKNKFLNSKIKDMSDYTGLNLPIPYADFGNANFPVSENYPEKPIDDVKKYGVYGKTVNAKFKQVNLSKNLYLDGSSESKDMSDYINLEPNNITEQVKGYIETYGEFNYGSLNLTGDNKKGVAAANIIGSITSGGGVGLASKGVKTVGVTNFDLRSSLAGRVLGAAGVMKDTKLGMIGGQQLALALANNAAFNIQQDVLGALNIQDNVLSLIKGNGIAGFPRPNYNITVPGGGVGRLADYTSKLLGFTIPRSYMTDGGSIFQSESGEVDNISRANELIMTTGKGQLKALIANVNANMIGTSPSGYDNPMDGSPFRSGYVAGYKNSNREKNEDTLTANIYAFQKGNGMINLFNREDEIIADLSYLREEKVTGLDGYGFQSPDELFLERYDSESGNHIMEPTFSWSTKNDKEKTTNSQKNFSREIIPINDPKTKKSLLVKTQKLFNSVGMKNIVSRKGEMNKPVSTQLQQTNGGGISKGNAVLSEASYNKLTGRANSKSLDTAEETYCRAWTTYSRYDSIQGGVKYDRAGLVRHGTWNGTGLYGRDDVNSRVPFRLNTENSVLEDTGFVHIAPYTDDFHNPDLNIAITRSAKNYMLSIENLAWHDKKEMLPKGELGLGDPITGKQGRVMWFPPYDIQISESTSVDWESHKFIGRGENMYTYSNTERSGNLSFKIIVDHSTYTNTFRGTNGPDDHYVASFMAGCLEPDSMWTDRFTVQDISKSVKKKEIIPQKKVVPPEQKVPTPMTVYFPNDNSVFDDVTSKDEKDVAITFKFSEYENGMIGGVDIDYDTNKDGTGGGIGRYRGVYTSTNFWPDTTNFGLNNNGPSYKKNPNTASKIGDTDYMGLFSEGYYDALAKYLKEECNFCKAKVTGFASDQGDDTPNGLLAKHRATYIAKLLQENVGPKMGLTTAQSEATFKADEKNSKELSTFEPLVIPYVYKGKNKTISGKISSNGCKVCPTTMAKVERLIACPVDTEGCKMDRYVKIVFTYDAAAALAAISQPADCIVTADQTVSEKTTEKFYNETMFFDRLKKSDKFIFDKFRDKIKYFHPAFHSTTPEGFNSRLTFLQQCTRQGPTDNHTTNNLAFGRPPVCILRVGDFYHTKIIIDSINIDYEPLVWDLNPEGIGVQPMIANVSLSFKFIGAESLTGPINKLQNALSFNYYANTQVYDGRADYLSKLSDNGGAQYGTGAMGVFLNNGLKTINPDVQTGAPVTTPGTEKNSCETNQEKESEKVKEDAITPPAKPKKPKITGIDVIIVRRTTSKTIAVDANGTNTYQLNNEFFKDKYFIGIRLKNEGIVDGANKLITDKELEDFITNGIRIKIERSPKPDTDNRYQELVAFHPETDSRKNSWDLFSGIYNLGSVCELCTAGEPVIKLIKEGNYVVSVTYTDTEDFEEKIFNMNVVVGETDYYNPPL